MLSGCSRLPGWSAGTGAGTAEREPAGEGMVGCIEGLGRRLPGRADNIVAVALAVHTGRGFAYYYTVSR